MRTPSRSDGYRAVATDRISPAFWNAIVPNLCREIDGLQALTEDVEAVITSVANGNLDAVLQGQLATRLSSTQAAFDALKAALDLAQDQLVAIQTGIVIAQSVQVAAGGITDQVRSVQEVLDMIGERLAALKTNAELLGDPTVPTPAVDIDTQRIINAEWFMAQRATAALLRELTTDRRFVTPKSMADAMGFVTETATATITPDFSKGFNRAYLLPLNATLGQPTGMKDGLAVVCEFQQDATGGRTLSVSTTYHKFPGGVIPPLSTAPNAVDRFSGMCRVVNGASFVRWSGVERNIR